MILAGVVRECARRFGDRTAFVAAAGWTVTYADLDRLSDEAAVGLARVGVRAGDLVALMLMSTPDYVVAYVALAKLGVVTSGINPRLAAPERSKVMDVLGPKLVLATAQLARGVSIDAEVLEVAQAERPDEIMRGLRVSGESPPGLAGDPEHPAAIVLTSGTTGVPKGAVFRDRELRAISEMEAGHAWGGGAPAVSSTEFAHVGVMTKLPWYLRTGRRMHLMRRWRAADALRIVAEERMETVGGIPSQIALMLREPDFDSYDWSHVRTVVAGAGPSWPALVREASARFDAAYSVRYSCTESGGLGTLTGPDADEEEVCSTVGLPRSGVELEVRDEDDRRVPDGEVGEVCLRSPAVMSEYWRDPEATARTLRGGWVHTGDLGTIDDRGLLRIVGRSKEMFVRGGYNVFPVEVEAVLASHLLVAQVAVVPRADPVMGEVGVAVVVPSDPANPPSLDDLRLFASDKLAAFKLPEAIRVVDALPLTSMHKVDRRRLAKEDEAGAG